MESEFRMKILNGSTLSLFSRVKEKRKEGRKGGRKGGRKEGRRMKGKEKKMTKAYDFSEIVRVPVDYSDFSLLRNK